MQIRARERAGHGFVNRLLPPPSHLSHQQSHSPIPPRPKTPPPSYIHPDNIPSPLPPPQPPQLLYLGLRAPIRKHRRPLRRAMQNMHDVATRGSVFMQQGLDSGASGGDVGGGEEARGVFGLGVDEDEGAVGWGSGGGGKAD